MFQLSLSATSGYLLATAARTLRDVASLDARARDAGKRIATFTIDAEIRFATAADRAAFVEALAADLARRIAEYHDERAQNGRRFRVVASIYPAATPPPSDDPGAAAVRRTTR